MTGGYQPVSGPVQVPVPGQYQYQPQPPVYGQQQQAAYPDMMPPQMQQQFGNKQRRKRGAGNKLVSGLVRQTGTGTLAPSLILTNDTIDIIFPVHWIYPPKIDVLQKQDIDCIKSKLNRKQRDRAEFSEEENAAFVSVIEEECLKKSGHFASNDAVYETPSDYDPLSINMGQLIVYRYMLRCKCKSSSVGYGQKCATIVPYDNQGWPALMGRWGNSIYNRRGAR